MASLLGVALAALLLEDDDFVTLNMGFNYSSDTCVRDNGGANIYFAILVFCEKYFVKRQSFSFRSVQAINIESLVFLHFILQPCYFNNYIHDFYSVFNGAQR